MAQSLKQGCMGTAVCVCVNVRVRVWAWGCGGCSQKDGVEKIHGLGTLSAFEQKKLGEMLPELKKSIEKGVAFAKSA